MPAASDGRTTELRLRREGERGLLAQYRRPSVLACGSFLLAACLCGGGARAEVAPAPGGEEAVARIYFEDNAVVAQSATGREQFRIEHWSKPVGPVKVGGRFYYAYSIYLVEVDSILAHVTRRIPFPAVVEGLDRQGDSIRVTLTDWEGERWTFHPDRPGLVLLPADEEAIAASRREAENTVGIQNFDIHVGFAGQYKAPAASRIVRSGVLDEAGKRNPTNPWFYLVKGAMLTHLGRTGEARRAFRAAASAEGAPFFDYLRMSSTLALMGEFAESQIAFERGLAEFVRAGYEPELLMSAEAYRLYMGADSDGDGWLAASVGATTGLEDVDRSIELMERTWWLAPRCEGVAYAFAGMAEFLERQDRPEDAAVWYARAREAVRYSQSVGSRQFVNASVACLIALVILLAILFVKSFPAQRKDLAGEGGWFAGWKKPGGRFRRMAFAYANRLELLGIFLVAAAGFASSVLVMRGERALRRSLAIPEEARTGTWIHPRAVDILNDLSRDSEAARLLWCIAQQQAGTDEKKTYSDLAGGGGEIAAIARNNLGAILHSDGKYDDAEEAFRKALELDAGLTEAKYNLDRPADSARVSRMRKYRPGEKIIALPDAKILASAFAGAPKSGKPSAVLLGRQYRIGWPNWLTMLVTCAVGLLVLPFFFIRRDLREQKKRGARGDRAPARRPALASLAYVVPWTSPRLAPWGVLLAGWIYCVIALVLVIRGEFLTTLDPEVSKAIVQNFGLAGGVFFASEQWLAFFGPVGVVVLWAANLLFLLRAGSQAGQLASGSAGARLNAGKAGIARPAAVKAKEAKLKAAGPPTKLARRGEEVRPEKPAAEPVKTRLPEKVEKKPEGKPAEKVEEKEAEAPAAKTKEKPVEEEIEDKTGDQAHSEATGEAEESTGKEPTEEGPAEDKGGESSGETGAEPDGKA